MLLFFFLAGSFCVCPTSQHVPSSPLLHRIRSIFRLVVRDASGGDHSFTRDAVDLRLGGGEETLRLRGPGELMLLLGRATFLRDSQVCVSTPHSSVHLHVY